MALEAARATEGRPPLRFAYRPVWFYLTLALGPVGYAIALNKVACWGRGSTGELGQLGPGGNPNVTLRTGPGSNSVDLGGVAATRVAAGDQNACALLSTGELRCWGNREFGAIGSPAGSSGVFGTPADAFRVW